MLIDTAIAWAAAIAREEGVGKDRERYHIQEDVRAIGESEARFCNQPREWAAAITCVISTMLRSRMRVLYVVISRHVGEHGGQVVHATAKMHRE